jgi:hypothetical protein
MRFAHAAVTAAATATKADEPAQQPGVNEPDDQQEVPEAVPVVVVDPPAPNAPAATPGTPGQPAPAAAAAPVPRVIMVDPTTGVPLEPLDEEQPATEPSNDPAATPGANPTTNSSSRQLPPGRTFGTGNNNNNGSGRNRTDRGSGRDTGSSSVRGGSLSRGGPSASTGGLPSDFAILNSRSIFVKGGRLPPPGGEIVDRRSSDEGARPPPVTPLVFDGVLKDESTANQAYAIIEDTVNAKVLVFKVGDSVPTGAKISNITLDKMDLTGADGKVLSIALGQNLQGGAGPGVLNRTTPITSGPGAASGSTSAPALSVPPGTPRQPGESIADYLRRKRLEGK